MRQNSNDNGFPTGLLILIFLLAAGLAAAWFYSRNRGGGGTAPAGQRVFENGLVYGGIPQAGDDAHNFEVLRNKAYEVGYSESYKDPLWSAYHLMPLDHYQNVPRPEGFFEDDRTTAQICQQDYNHTGYDRGHMCPNHAIEIRFGADAQHETFFMSNIVPQRPALNREVWERLEMLESDHYPREFGDEWVFDGPVFHDPPPRFKSGVAIPDACYKILIREENGRPTAEAFIIPQTVNGHEKLQPFLVSVREVENQTHLNFFMLLSQNEKIQLETQTPTTMWPEGAP